MTVKPNQPSFAAGELAPELYGRVDLAKYQVGLRLAENLFVRPHGGIVNRPGTKFVAEVLDSTVAGRLVPFSFSTLQTYVLEFGYQRMRVIRDGGLVLEAEQDVAAISQAKPGVVTLPGHGYSDGDDVQITSGIGMDQLTPDVLQVRNASSDSFELGYKGGVESIDTSGFVPFFSGKIARVYSLATAYEAGDLPDLKWIQSADVMYLVHPNHPVRKLGRTDHAAWSLSDVAFLPAIAAPGGVSATNSVGAGAVTYSYKVTAIADATGEESLPSAAAATTNDLTVAGNKNRISWSAVVGAARYEVYKDDNGIYGFIGGTEGLSFEDQNIIADLSSTPPKQVDPFAGSGNKPATATFFEQRLAFANSTNNPQTLWFSTTANFENFGSRVPAQDDDAVTVTLVARQVNAIRHLVAKEDLWALTSGGEWRIRGGGDVDFITPSSVTTKRISSWGCSEVPPLEVGTSVVYVVDKGQGVRDLFNQITVEQFDVQEGSDLSILSPHLFQGRRVKAWAYAQVPNSLIWAVMDDGALISFCYFREHRVYAWTRHATETLEAEDGRFEDVAVVAEGQEDLPYFLVRRVVNGRQVRYIERMPQRVAAQVEEAFYLDCGATYQGRPADRISGLRHLEGRSVVALSDGNVVSGLVVGDGQVTLPAKAGKVHVGLPYRAALRTLPLELSLRDGSTSGRHKRLVRLTAKVRQTRGLWAGPSETRLREHRQRQGEAWAAPIALFDGDIEIDTPAEWSREADLWIVQSDPLPMEILALTPEYDLGR